MKNEEPTKERLLELIFKLEKLRQEAEAQIVHLENVTMKRLHELEANVDVLEHKHKLLCQVLNSLLPENRLN